MTQEDPPSPPQEFVQELRSVEKHLPLSSIPPANPDDTFYVDCHLDPDTQKGIVLWEDILHAFNHAVHVRHGARVVPFLKGSDFRTLEPRRIAAIPNTILDVVVDTPLANMEPSPPRNLFEESLSGSMQEDEETDRTSITSQDVTTTCNIRRSPVYGLEEAAMGNYSHIDKSLAFSSARGPQALLDDRPTDNDTLSTPLHSDNGYSSPSQGPQSSTTHLPMQKTLAQAIISATNGGTEAQVALGDMYQNGKGVAQDYQAAMEWYLKAAEQGDAVGQRYVGLLHYYSLGVPRDYSTAMDWSLKAANQGYAPAQRNIGLFYQKGYGVPQDYALAMDWLLKAATQGLATAQYCIGLLYHEGDGVPQDYAQAMDWYLKAANQGDASAQDRVGDLYHNGHGVPRNYEKAMTWYRKAADQGNIRAQFTIGLYYSKGHGVLQDYGQALSWYLKAASQGHETFQYNIGVLYQNGQGVPRSKAKAVEWFQMSARQRSKDANKVLEKLKENE